MLIEGIGTYGIVISTPRITLENEEFDLIKDIEYQVSKILFEKIENEKIENKYKPIDPIIFEKEFDELKSIIKEYPIIFNDEHFMLPLDGGKINKENLNKLFREKYLLKPFQKKLENINFEIINSLLSYTENDIYQIIYNKGFKINLDINIFFEKMINIASALQNSNLNGIFFDDIKFKNIVLHNNKIKMIDYADIINLNLSLEKIFNFFQNSKLDNIYYFPYNSIYNLLIYSNIDKLNLLGKKDNLYQLFYSLAIEYDSFVIYKFELLNNLTNLCNHIIPNYKINIKVTNTRKYDNIDNDFNIKSLSISQLVNSIKNRIIVDKKSDNNNYIDNIFMTYNEYIGDLTIKDKLFLLLSKNNLYSFGFIFIEWIYKYNRKILSDIETDIFKIEYIKYMVNVIAMCCSDPLIYNDLVYFTSYNFEDIISYMNSCIIDI